jgi:hypothetical protein
MERRDKTRNHYEKDLPSAPADPHRKVSPNRGCQAKIVSAAGFWQEKLTDDGWYYQLGNLVENPGT